MTLFAWYIASGRHFRFRKFREFATTKDEMEKIIFALQQTITLSTWWIYKCLSVSGQEIR